MEVRAQREPAGLGGRPGDSVGRDTRTRRLMRQRKPARNSSRLSFFCCPVAVPNLVEGIRRACGKLMGQEPRQAAFFTHTGVSSHENDLDNHCHCAGRFAYPTLKQGLPPQFNRTCENANSAGSRQPSAVSKTPLFCCLPRTACCLLSSCFRDSWWKMVACSIQGVYNCLGF